MVVSPGTYGRVVPGPVPVEVGVRVRMLLRWLAAHGALEPAGCRILQDDLAEQVSIPRRPLARLRERMEEMGVLHVTRTTIDGCFGSPRGANIYRLLVTPDEWDERAEQFAQQQREATRRRRTAGQRAERARSSAVEAKPKAVRYGAVAEPTIGMLTHEELDRIADSFNLSDEELFGW